VLDIGFAIRAATTTILQFKIVVAYIILRSLNEQTPKTDLINRKMSRFSEPFTHN